MCSSNTDTHKQLFDNQIETTTTYGHLEWLNSKEAAEYLRISTGMLIKLVSQGRVPFYKLGRSNRYKLSELRELLEANKRGGSRGNKI